MHFDSVTGWVRGVRHCPSPNFNLRPQGDAVSLLVIHNISLPPGQFGTGKVQAFFQNRLDPNEHPYFEEIRHLTVSAHFLIEPTAPSPSSSPVTTAPGMPGFPASTVARRATTSPLASNWRGPTRNRTRTRSTLPWSG